MSNYGRGTYGGGSYGNPIEGSGIILPYVPLENEKVTWKFVLANSSTMANIGELQCTNKQLEMVLNRPGSCSFRIPFDAPLAGDMGVLTRCVKVYRITPTQTQLLWSGPIWSREEIAHEEFVQVNCVGWFELLNHRFLRYEKRYTSGAQTGGQIALDLLSIANNQKDGPISPTNPDGTGSARTTQIAVGTTTDDQIRNIVYPQWHSIGRAIQEFSEIENGYDWELTPDTRTLNIHDSTFPGAWNRDRPQAQFGFNWGPHNLLTFSRSAEAATLVNSQFAIGKFGHALAQDTTTMAAYGIFEDIQQITDVTDTTVLQGFASGELAVKRLPRIVYQMTPHPYVHGYSHVPQPFIDYRIGDRVYITVKRDPIYSINQQAVRVYGMSISIDDSGSERITSLQVSP